MDVLQAIKTRRSVRSYSDRPIPADVLDRMRQALRYAPSAGNNQPWHFILVSDPELRRKVAQAANNQRWIAQAPVTIVGCGVPKQAYQRVGGHRSSIDIDLAIALDHLTLAAVAEGLGTCWIAAFDEDKVKRLLEVPADVRIVAMTPLGYPSSPDLNHPLDESDRRPAAEVFSADRFGRK
jgi:nitroreductase